MIDLDEVNSAIEEISNAGTTLSNCQKLASLITVKNYFQPQDNVESEINDILPSYVYYRETKKAYQLEKVSEIELFSSMKKFCTEIGELIETIYSSSDRYAEREIIMNSMINTINSLRNT